MHIVARISRMRNHRQRTVRSIDLRIGVAIDADQEIMTTFTVMAIGRVESTLDDLASAPRQADEGAPEAWLVFEPHVVAGLRDIHPGDEVFVLTWLHLARRDVLSVHPRGDTARPQEGVFSTRSPHRPNPIGLHRVEVTAVSGARLQVRHLEVVDGTPIIDIKPFLIDDISRR
jgi:tRNA-Thr(GGU) m(6)t(6)A37 methyltransferase TsaA